METIHPPELIRRCERLFNEQMRRIARSHVRFARFQLWRCTEGTPRIHRSQHAARIASDRLDQALIFTDRVENSLMAQNITDRGAQVSPTPCDDTGYATTHLQPRATHRSTPPPRR